MQNSQILNPSEPQNKLLSKSSNFLNSQNYILGNGEKKMVLSSFLGTEILKKVLRYTSIFYSLLFFSLGLILIYVSISILLFTFSSFSFSIYIIYVLLIILLIILSILILLISLLSFLLGIKLFKNIKVSSMKDFFYMSDMNIYYGLANLILYLFLLLFIVIISYIYNYFIIFFIFLFISLITFFITIMQLISEEYNLEKLFKNVVFNFISRINYLNILFSPLILLMIILITFIVDIIVFTIIKTQKFKIYKIKLFDNLFSNFKNNNLVYSNGFYEISKK